MTITGMSDVSHHVLSPAVFTCDQINGRPAINEPAANIPVRFGYGQCSQCKCHGFVESIENNKICGRCGHAYIAHW